LTDRRVLRLWLFNSGLTDIEVRQWFDRCISMINVIEHYTCVYQGYGCLECEECEECDECDEYYDHYVDLYDRPCVYQGYGCLECAECEECVDMC